MPSGSQGHDTSPLAPPWTDDDFQFEPPGAAYPVIQHVLPGEAANEENPFLHHDPWLSARPALEPLRVNHRGEPLTGSLLYGPTRSPRSGPTRSPRSASGSRVAEAGPRVTRDDELSSSHSQPHTPRGSPARDVGAADNAWGTYQPITAPDTSVTAPNTAVVPPLPADLATLIAGWQE